MGAGFIVAVAAEPASTAGDDTAVDDSTVLGASLAVLAVAGDDRMLVLRVSLDEMLGVRRETAVGDFEGASLGAAEAPALCLCCAAPRP
jgi:hypothetical protein